MTWVPQQLGVSSTLYKAAATRRRKSNNFNANCIAQCYSIIITITIIIIIVKLHMWYTLKIKKLEKRN